MGEGGLYISLQPSSHRSVAQNTAAPVLPYFGTPLPSHNDKPDEVSVRCADAALDMQPLHSKSLFRRALARGKLVDNQHFSAACSLSHIRKAVADLGAAATCTSGSNHSRILQEIQQLENVLT